MTDAAASIPQQLSRRSKIVAALLPLIVLATLLVLPSSASAGILFDPDLVVSMTDSPDPVSPGGSVSVAVLVTNDGNEDSTNTQANFYSPSAAIDSVTSNQGECSIFTGKGHYVICDLGTIWAPSSSVAAPAPAGLASNQAEFTVVLTAPSESGSFDTFADASPGGEGENDQNPGDNSDTETTTVASGDSDSGTIPPGGSLSTVNGTQGNPVTQADPFALTLKNSTSQPLDAAIAEEPCDGTQSGDPLCADRRLGGVLGNFQFQPATTLRLRGAVGPVVTIGKLYYDRTLVRLRNGVKILYQKNPGGPVIRLPRCDPNETECFRVKNLASGDQIIRVAFSSDPRVTRG